MKTISDIINQIHSRLSSLYDKNERDSLVYLIFDHLLKYTKFDIHLRKEEEISLETEKNINNIVEQLIEHKPIQYIIGHTEFYDLSFYVDSNTLIPRQETEELVDLIINESRDKSINILDIGTGTGCIAISLASNLPMASVKAVDISEGAIKMAKRNAQENNTKVDFILTDILDKDARGNLPMFDLIVSNPPYVMDSEKKLMEDNVLKYEPHTALFVSDNDPLIFYREIAYFACQHLNKNGKLYFEINEALGKEMVEMLTEQGFKNIFVIKDIHGKDRMVKAEK